MKTCYMCGGDIERRIVEVEGVIVKDVPVEVCTRCGEKYFNTFHGIIEKDLLGTCTAHSVSNWTLPQRRIH